MPELPEVEVVRRGLEKEIKATPFLLKFEFRRKDLRHPIPQEKLNQLHGQKIISVERRAKFLLFRLGSAGFISHLGMTGTWRVLENADEAQIGKHDHILIYLGKQSQDLEPKVLVYRDPRRFGIFDFWEGNVKNLPWGVDLAPEPLTDEFNEEYLFKQTRKSSRPIKSFIMDQAFVVGVGNIYASESLFLAGIRPTRRTRSLSQAECKMLTRKIKSVLEKAIAAGGSSISDFKTFYGTPGEFHLQHFVYGREGQACRKCNTVIKVKSLAGRSTFWCSRCQN